MKKPPDGRPRISSAVFYDDAHGAIDFLCRAFGFELRLKVEGEGGRVDYSELTFGEGLVSVHQSGDGAGKSPRSVGGANTQVLAVIVDDADAHCEHARAAGAKIVEPPKTSDHGDDYWTDRGYRAEDLEGHQWWFWQRLREGKPRAP